MASTEFYKNGTLISGGSPSAANTTYSNATSGLTSGTVQGAIDELASGGDSAVWLTQAEYDALPASKTTDGKTYQIYDSDNGETVGTLSEKVEQLNSDLNKLKPKTRTINATTDTLGGFSMPFNYASETPLFIILDDWYVERYTTNQNNIYCVVSSWDGTRQTSKAITGKFYYLD